MINARELRIGNWVKVPIGTCFNTTEYVQVKSIGESRINSWEDMSASGGVPFMDIEPITITPEILEKSGFEKKYNNIFQLIVRAGMFTDFNLEYDGECFKFNIKMGRIPLIRQVKYLHDLQNFFYSFWEYELQIEL